MNVEIRNSLGPRYKTYLTLRSMWQLLILEEDNASRNLTRWQLRAHQQHESERFSKYVSRLLFIIIQEHFSICV
jgi:hypothetical protein